MAAQMPLFASEAPVHPLRQQGPFDAEAWEVHQIALSLVAEVEREERARKILEKAAQEAMILRLRRQLDSGERRPLPRSVNR